MPHEVVRRNFDSIKKEAKRWLAALRGDVPDARARLVRILPDAARHPTLRDVQLALAHEHGFPGWVALKRALAPDAVVSSHTLQQYEEKAEALLDAYRTGTPEAMARHYRHTWHRREWSGPCVYVQLDLGKRPEGSAVGASDIDITFDDARYLISVEHGFASWAALIASLSRMPGGVPMTARPVRVRFLDTAGESEQVVSSRDWHAVLRLFEGAPSPSLEANGQMTDDMLREVACVEHLVALDLSGSQAVSDEGIRQVARLPNLRTLDLSGTAITDRGLEVLRALPGLQVISLARTRVTDQGAAHLAECEALQRVNLGGTSTGDGAVRALAGKQHLRELTTGKNLTDAGLPLLHELPVFKTWKGGDSSLDSMGYTQGPNHLVLRGGFTDRGMQYLRGLDGLFGLNLDASDLLITAAGLPPLVSLPHLGMLRVDPKDDWMPHLAEMPSLRFLGAQDTTAGDEGFAALARSRTIEYIWGRRCHNLRQRGFTALASMPALQGLSVSCLNVDDIGISALPGFPALRVLMPMDVPDAGYRYIGQCKRLESLLLMYCRDTTDAATEQIVGLPRLLSYFNSYTTITDRTPELLSRMETLERITFDTCHRLTDAGVAALARLPRLKELHVSGRGLTPAVRAAFQSWVRVQYA